MFSAGSRELVVLVFARDTLNVSKIAVPLVHGFFQPEIFYAAHAPDTLLRARLT